MTIHKALHPRDNFDRLYVSRKEGRRGLTSFEDSVDASIQQLEDNLEKCGERLITATKNKTDNRGPTEQQYPENKIVKKNDSMDVLSD